MTRTIWCNLLRMPDFLATSTLYLLARWFLMAAREDPDLSFWVVMASITMSLNFTDSDISDDVWYWNLKKKKLIPEQFQICSLKFCKTSSALLRDCNMKNAAVVCSKVGISKNFYSSSVRKMRSNWTMKINSVRIYQSRYYKFWICLYILWYATWQLLGAGVLGDSLGSFRYGVLGQLARQEQFDSSLDLARSDGRPTGWIYKLSTPNSNSPLVVVSQLACLSSNSLEQVVDKGVHDGHGLGGHTRVGMHLLQHLNIWRNVNINLIRIIMKSTL